MLSRSPPPQALRSPCPTVVTSRHVDESQRWNDVPQSVYPPHRTAAYLSARVQACILRPPWMTWLHRVCTSHAHQAPCMTCQKRDSLSVHHAISSATGYAYVRIRPFHHNNNENSGTTIVSSHASPGQPPYLYVEGSLSMCTTA